MIGKILCGLAVVAAASSSAMAASKDYSVTMDKRMVIGAQHGPFKVTPNFIHKPKASTIYSNVASAYPNGLYFGGEGDTLCGPSCAIGEQIWVATQFTPTASATAVEVDAATGYIEGTDELTLNILADSGGAPGKTLWSGKATNLPEFGDCCGLASAKIKGGGLALTGGTPYWIAVTTNKNETTTFAAWNLATVDQIDSVPAASNTGTGWQTYATTLPPAFAVYSK